MKFEFRPYRRTFHPPLRTHHGDWRVRRGILVRLTNVEGASGWGEIAPVDFLGSESFEQALGVCRSLPDVMTFAQIQQLPSTLPACRFGLESAWEGLTSPLKPQTKLQAQPQPSSILLPTGAAVLESRQLFAPQPSTFKWKIGVAPLAEELETFESLVGLLPTGSKLRLDANGGLSWQQACCWLQVCDAYAIEFLEQPLLPEQFALMQKLSQRYQTPLALDESVTCQEQLQAYHRQGWSGIFVIKAPIAGSPIQLRQFCQEHDLDIVWSSVFETSVARQYIEQSLIAALPPSRRALGFGVNHWFQDRWETLAAEQLWQRLGCSEGDDEPDQG